MATHCTYIRYDNPKCLISSRGRPAPPPLEHPHYDVTRRNRKTQKIIIDAATRTWSSMWPVQMRMKNWIEWLTLDTKRLETLILGLSNSHCGQDSPTVMNFKLEGAAKCLGICLWTQKLADCIHQPQYAITHPLQPSVVAGRPSPRQRITRLPQDDKARSTSSGCAIA